MQINFEKIILDNGLKVLVHQDKSAPIIAFNMLYNIGSKHENPTKTGLAHLFEHLMFGGTKKVPEFDELIDMVGGENNAFTNNDFTNYYLSIPKDNIETAFFIESDRMVNLNLNHKRLEVQKKVVVEEFIQRYNNQPYGDASLLYRPMVFTRHSYGWSTIGKDISHIESVTLEEALAFYNSYYMPNNAILVIAGDVDPKEMFELSKKWFGDIPKGVFDNRIIEEEPPQKEARELTVYRDVPHNAIYKVYPICDRKNQNYYVFDLISDVLSNGESSRMYVELVKKQRLFNSINAYISGDMDKGFFLISGHLEEGVDMEKAEKAIEAQIQELVDQKIRKEELQKIKNKLETSVVFTNIKVLEKAMNLAYFELLGDASLINLEDQKYQIVSEEDIQKVVSEYLKPELCSTLHYYSMNFKK